MTLGLIFLIAGTLLQALTYCLIKSACHKTRQSSWTILVQAQILMGLVCLIPFFVLNLHTQFTAQFLISAVLTNVSYLIAQFLLFTAITHSDPSTACPYLSLKLPLTAMLAILLTSESINGLQALSLAALTVLALLFSQAVRIKPVILLLVIGSAACFALCDLAVLQASRSIEASSPMLTGLFTVICCDVLFLALLPVLLFTKSKVNLTQLKAATPLSLSWITGVSSVIIGFNYAGVIAGNIILALRALAVVALTALFFRSQLGREPGRFKLKAVYALLMCLCASGFYLSD